MVKPHMELKLDEKNKIVIENSEYKNSKFVNIRKWWLDDQGEWKPGKAGITVKPDHWDEFVRLIVGHEVGG